MRLFGFQNTLARDFQAGRTRRDVPPGGVRAGRSWTEETQDGHAVHRFGPAGREAEGPTYLHLHGGGFITGLLNPQTVVMTRLADLGGFPIVLPDYPLPPDRDAEGMLTFCDEVLSAELAKGPVVLGGDSAGGTLAILLAARRAAAGRPLPQSLVLWSPLCDLDVNAAGYDGWDGVIEPDGVRLGAARFAGAAGDAVNPARVPLEGLPPITVFAGERDPLYPDIRAWIARAEAAGVHLTTHTEPLGHYWMFLPQPEAERTRRQIAEAVTSSP